MDNENDPFDDMTPEELAHVRSIAADWAQQMDERERAWYELPWYYRLWFWITGRGL